MKPADLRDEPIRRGPITRRFNGRGVRPCLAELAGDPGHVYRVTKLVTIYTLQGQPRRVCRRCIRGLLEFYEGHASVTWQDEPPTPGERCPGASATSGSGRRRRSAARWRRRVRG